MVKSYIVKSIIKNIHYIWVPIFYFLVANVGSFFTAQGVKEWYPNIVKPAITPPGGTIGVIWTVIYVLTAISLILFINKTRHEKYFYHILSLYLFNGFVNAMWSYIFFVKNMLFLAFIDAILIWLTVGLLIIFTWQNSRLSALLLLPYFLWVSFASYLSFTIFRLN